jgi:hypothetical protein
MPGEDRTGFQSWRYRPEDKVVNTSFDHTVDRTMIAGSAVSHLQLYATEPILVTLPNREKEESCHITTFLSKGSSGAWMKEERDTSRGGAYLRCPVSTSVHFSLRNEGTRTSEYIRLCEGRESLSRIFKLFRAPGINSTEYKSHEREKALSSINHSNLSEVGVYQ